MNAIPGEYFLFCSFCIRFQEKNDCFRINILLIIVLKVWKKKESERWERENGKRKLDEGNEEGEQ